jgi:hypothetical protein
VLKERRRQAILAAIEIRIRTEAEREEYARHKIREELVDMATAGNVDGVRALLQQMATEAEAAGLKPR